MPVQWSIVIWEMNGKAQFTPLDLDVSAGDSVVWSNQTGTPHMIAINIPLVTRGDQTIPGGQMVIPPHGSSQPCKVLSLISYSCTDFSGPKATGTIRIRRAPGDRRHSVVLQHDETLSDANMEVSTGDTVTWSNATDVEQALDVDSENTELRRALEWGTSPAYTTPTEIRYYYQGGVKGKNKITEGQLRIKADVLAPAITKTSPNICLSPKGGEPITLTGTNLLNATVKVKRAEGTVIEAVVASATSTTVVFTTPAGTARSWAEVIVTTDKGEAKTSFAYKTATPTIKPLGPITLCQGSKVLLTASPASSYRWSTGATTQAITVTASGNYSVTVKDANGCTSEASEAVIVTVNPLPVVTITADGPTAFCQGGKVKLTASPASSYLWSTGATTQSITVTTSGNYSVNVTNANDCSATSSPTTVTVNPLPVVTITADGPTTFCNGGKVMLTASPASSYRWSTGATTQSITVTASGSYSVTVTNTNGCSATSAPASVTVNPLPVVTITADGPTTFCNGGSVTVTVFVDGMATMTRVVTASTTINPIHTNLFGCQSEPVEPMVITVNPNPNATITAPSTVAYNATGCTASVEDAGVGATYAWIITNGTITAGTGTAGITFKSGAVGTLTLQCTVTTSCGYQSTQSKNVDVVAQAG